jgi:carbamoyltransferase
MNILGVNSVIMDSAAALLQDGRVVAAMEEERFSRIKHDGAFPVRSIQACLKVAGLKASDLDAVCVSFDEWLAVRERLLRAVKNGSFFSIPRMAWKRHREFLKATSLKKNLKTALDGEALPKLFKFRHHDCHAASTFFISPFERAAILVMDSIGESYAVSCYKGCGSRLAQIFHFPFGESLGALYTSITEYLGFRPNSGEGKVMGLASYGAPVYYDALSKMVKKEKSGRFSLDLSYFTHHRGQGPHCSPKFIKEFGPGRLPESAISEKEQNMAASLQKILEDVALHITRHIRQQTKEAYLCLSGGVALNSVMNAILLEESGFKDVYLMPSPGDSGSSLGACLYYYHHVCGNPRREALHDAFLGLSYDEASIAKALKNGQDIFYVKRPDFIALTARLLSVGRIVGWFQGRFEFGPRALGHRSILADPRKPDMKDILNARVKFRESFRPFAPAVLEEKSGDYFTNPAKNPFMLFVFKMRASKRALIPSVVHVDGSGRGQTVSRDVSPEFWELIRAFERLTGEAVLLNTSFNVRGQPIVNTPEEALDCYLRTDMDYLCLGDYMVWKKGKPDPMGIMS